MAVCSGAAGLAAAVVDVSGAVITEIVQSLKAKSKE